MNSPLIGQSIDEDTAELGGDENTTEDVPFDRTGKARVWNEVVDIGAYEYTPRAGRVHVLTFGALGP